MEFKKTIYVQEENLGNYKWINASTDINEVESGEIAIYELKEVKKAKKTVTLE